MDSLNMVTYKSPKSPVAEIFRALRTNIKFASFQKDIKSIVITSPGPNEGKSTIVANLAITMAQSGNRVLIMEGDLRNPTVHKMFQAENNKGLTNILAENKPYKGYIIKYGIPNLDILLCGPKPPNPAELLGSAKMRNLLDELHKDYDYILIDTPPVVVVTDAAVLASACDGTIIVVSSGEADTRAAVKAKELLDNVGANVIGAVLNKVKPDRASGYYDYYHYYYDSPGKSKKKGLFGKTVTHI